jgi:hypothetical protein
LGQRAQRRPKVADDTDLEHVMGIHLGRELADMDHPLLGIPVPALRVVLDHVVADADHQVGTLETAGDQVVTGQSRGAQRQRMGAWDHALGHEGHGHRDVQRRGEGIQVGGCARTHHPVTGQHHRMFGLRDQGSGLGEAVLGGPGGVRLLDPQRGGVR